MRFAALACACLVLAAGGCGGDDEDEPAGSTETAPAAAETTADERRDVGEPGRGPDGDEPSQRSADRPQAGDDERGPIPRAEYIRRADRICFDARADLAESGRKIQGALRRLADKEIDPEAFQRVSGDLTAQFAAIADRAVERIEALPPPDSRRAALEDYLKATRTQADLLAQQAEAQREGEVEGSVELNGRIAEAATQTRAAADRFGFRECGGGAG